MPVRKDPALTQISVLHRAHSRFHRGNTPRQIPAYSLRAFPVAFRWIGPAFHGPVLSLGGS